MVPRHLGGDDGRDDAAVRSAGGRAVARASRALPTAIFGVGYLAVWTAFGIVAYGLFSAATSFDLGRSPGTKTGLTPRVQ